MLVAALLVLAVAAEARNLKTTEPAKGDAVIQPQTFPPFDRLGGSGIPWFGIMPLFGSPGLGGFGGGSERD